MLNAKEKALLGQMLDEYSERLSNDGCNDWANFVQLLGAGRNVDYAWAIGSPFDANPKEPEPKTPAERTARLLRYAKVPNQALGDVQDLAAEHGFDLVRFWQPVAQAARWNPKETRTLDRLDISLDDVPERRREYQELRRAIGPPDAIDVSDALDELALARGPRGLRHRKGLPVRGQRTKTNARTRKGPRKPIKK